MKSHYSTLLAAALALASVGSLHAGDVTGKWKSEFDTQIGHLNYTYDLKQDGEKVTGKSIRKLEDTTTNIDIVDGKITGDKISFVEPLKIPDQDQEIRIEYSGTVTNDEMKLTRKVGDFATTEIVAKRVKEDAQIAGKWQTEFDSGIGKQEYVYEFKVDGDKLTGRAKGEFADTKSDTEIADGKVNGADVSFVENVDFNGQSVKITYSGKLAGDELKLKREVGDGIATEDIVAKRVKE